LYRSFGAETLVGQYDEACEEGHHDDGRLGKPAAVSLTARGVSGRHDLISA
jgi:hypothetical protein